MAITSAPLRWQARLLSAWQSRSALARLLWPLSLLYGWLVAARRKLYQVRFFRSARLRVPVVVVGNVLAGGAGKTPVVIAMVEALQSRGLRVGVVSRGYGRSSNACLAVRPDSAAGEVGDEPLLIHRRTGAPIAVAPSRTQAAQYLLDQHPELELILSDDGLQHLALQRDIEIGVFDTRGIGNGWLLPAGPLREPWPRALDLLVHSGEQAGLAGFQVRRSLADHGINRAGQQHALAGLPPPGKPKGLMAVAAIAQPEIFFQMLREQGLRLQQTLALSDHDDFQQWPTQTFSGYQILCTEKDAVKLWDHDADALAVPLQCDLGGDFFQAFAQCLQQRCPHSRASLKLSSSHGHAPS